MVFKLSVFILSCINTPQLLIVDIKDRNRTLVQLWEPWCITLIRKKKNPQLPCILPHALSALPLCPCFPDVKFLMCSHSRMEVQVHLPTKVNASLHHLLILHRKNYSSVSIANLSEILTFSLHSLIEILREKRLRQEYTLYTCFSIKRSMCVCVCVVLNGRGLYCLFKGKHSLLPSGFWLLVACWLI